MKLMMLSFNSFPSALSGLSLFLGAILATSVPETIAALDGYPGALQNILKNTHKSNLYRYPTDFTRGIQPKPFHSHNDYWRDVPFYSALASGAISVEADVWLFGDTLHVGHERSALTKDRTLESLYISSIMDTLRRQNPSTEFVDKPTRNGVFDTSSGQTLYLFIDVKTDGPATWAAVLKSLKPFLDADYLTVYDGTAMKPGPVTVIGTGNAPLEIIQATKPTPENPRYAFYDAQLAELDTQDGSKITAEVAPISNAQFGKEFGRVVKKGLNDTQLRKLRSQVEVAHSRGIKVRYWDTPGWPIGTRNAVWRVLYEEGVDLLNVDDLEDAAKFWEGQG